MKIPRHLFIISLFLVSCHADGNRMILGKPITFESPQLDIACSKVIQTFNDDFHGSVFRSRSGVKVNQDTIVSILNKLAKHQINENNNFQTFVKTCNDVQFFTWKSKSHKNGIARIEKVTYKADIPLEEGGINRLKVTDFDVYSINKPIHIRLRLVNDSEFLGLIVDDEKYYKLSESILVGVEKVIAGLDAIEDDCR